MKLIAGLGNPGIEYQFTPHNLGFLAIDRLAEQCGVKVTNRHSKAATAKAVIEGQEVLLAKPETWMNLSGEPVRELVERTGVDVSSELIVLYDDLALTMGTIRVRERGSAGGHNGMKSVIGCLGTQEFLRIRLGIRPEHAVGSGKEYVLSPMRKVQLALADEALDKAAEAVRVILAQGAPAAMNRFNQKMSEADEAE